MHRIIVMHEHVKENGKRYSNTKGFYSIQLCASTVVDEVRLKSIYGCDGHVSVYFWPYMARCCGSIKLSDTELHVTET